jgi:hypothetical protein
MVIFMSVILDFTVDTMKFINNTINDVVDSISEYYCTDSIIDSDSDSVSDADSDSFSNENTENSDEKIINLAGEYVNVKKIL